MSKPSEITREFTREAQWTAAQIKVLTERKTRTQIAKLEAENHALRQMLGQLISEIAQLRAKG